MRETTKPLSPVSCGSHDGPSTVSQDMALSVVIPTYGRDSILIDTIRLLLTMTPAAEEILVVDQTPQHDSETEEKLDRWNRSDKIRWLKLPRPSITDAMNRGLLESRCGFVLFVDDDIVPDPNLIAAHRAAYTLHPEAWAVAGRVLQPEDENQQPMIEGQRLANDRQESQTKKDKGLQRDLTFAFNGTGPAWVKNVMAGNLSVRRNQALAIGGFDGNFVPPVSYRFETEFAKRLAAAGGRIRFEPTAVIRHLREAFGGTRSQGSHLASASPLHGAGDYYYALCCGQGWGRVCYILHRPFREVRTRYHLAHPWWIPVKFVGELRAMGLAWRLYRRGSKLIGTPT